MPIYEIPPEQGIGETISQTLTDAYNALREEQVKSSRQIDGLSCLNTPEKVISLLNEQGINTSNLKIEVKNSVRTLGYITENHNGTSYANCEIKIFGNGNLIIDESFLGSEIND